MEKYLSKRKNESTEDNDSKIQKPETKESKQEQTEPEVPSYFQDKSVTEALTIPSTLKTEEEFEEHFGKMANYLLNEVTLMVNGKKHRLVELEFYLTSKLHPDPYTHCDEVQKTTANWYFHKTGKSYRGGSYKGLDISIGNGEDSVGGILIRSIESIGDKNLICGPCKSVDHILSVCKAASIVALVDDQMKSNISVEKRDNSPLYLVHTITAETKLPKLEVYRSPRFGLNMTKGQSKAQVQKQYLTKLYRFLTQPARVFKGKAHIIATLHHLGKKLDEISRITAAKLDTIKKYVACYEEGKKDQEVDKFLARKLSEDEVCTFFGAWSNLKKEDEKK